ncbi:hypothetical protein EN925_24860 [Mesorhizobium sp. M7A.F.Ca.US.006.04.2.1]|uniref:hypothetical protein n=1 Tax=unclassified Mesorhizobium TaxID=325217 RepID=UPI000FC9B4E7|nr:MULTISPECIES: hypothetical protein [unclassified Mesorhizobium]RUX71553.1 hypothetical protein EN990_28175 [Mesorhizobium sp. M7A.F.Ca.US.005.03.1.1]RUY09043.1 hypothetical protein EN991_30120 [Mesorhizobium sp. M7A.F.Ca.US.005.03.2.1]RVA86288.1 hypothetical protein EN925_24860 [Mesorhizobium sp. M7A.F.Ca.US.006.04.2.1]
MALLVNHNIQNGTYRLLRAPGDVRGRAEEAAPGTGAAGHRGLFAAYLLDFVDVFAVASETWNASVQERMETGLPMGEAILRTIEAKGIAGPAGHPRVVWLVRKYWLACDEENRRSVSSAVPPEVFLLEWLIQGGHDDYATLLTAMPYWPIGLDEHGNWC